jgi:hypothetical protein
LTRLLRVSVRMSRWLKGHTVGEIARPEGLNMPLRRIAAADELAANASGKGLLRGGLPGSKEGGRGGAGGEGSG